MDIFREYWNQNATFYKSVWRKILVQSANSKRTVRYMGTIDNYKGPISYYDVLLNFFPNRRRPLLPAMKCVQIRIPN